MKDYTELREIIEDAYEDFDESGKIYSLTEFEEAIRETISRDVLKHLIAIIK